MATAIEQNAALSMGDVLGALRERAPDVLEKAYVVGRWIWAEFHGPPPVETRNTLKELGFRWNPRRHVWQNSCGYRSKASASDPRAHYGTVAASAVVPEDDE